MPRLAIRIHFEDGAMIGPGKAELLERIAETGSIAGAGRAMNMSYKRAWSLVQTMNATFADPVVTRSRGGAAGGQAILTETGRAVAATYRALEASTRDATRDAVAHLESLRGERSKP